MSREYNYIFSRLVADKNDLVGLIAYGIYKQHKIEFIQSFKDKNGGQDPSEAEGRAFAMSSCADSSISQYRKTAETLLQQITLTAAREEINAFEDDMLRQYRSEIASAISDGQEEYLRNLGAEVKKQLPSWWASFGASLAGAFVFAIFLYVGFLLGSTSEKNTVELVSKTIESVSNMQDNNDACTDSISDSLNG